MRLPVLAGRRLAGVLLAIGLAGHVAFQLRPAIDKVRTSPSARDFASYHYAVAVAADGGDPYDVGALGLRSRAERTRRTVQPYFYPPPFLLAVTWALPMPLHPASAVMLALNEALLGGCVWLLYAAFGVAPWALALLLWTWSPIPDNAWMGQANLMALLPALAGLALARTRPLTGGILVGTAAMFKMSPALFLLYWALRRQWTAIAGAVLAAVVLTIASLPLVGPAVQWRFYTEVLPGFLVGNYHGLQIPISLPANHSVPDVFNSLWPGPAPTKLSASAIVASRAASVGLLALWAWRFRRATPWPGNEVLALGALTVLMVVLPAYTYEHHLVFLLLPVTIAATRIPRVVQALPYAIVLAVAWFFLAWPLEWLRGAQVRAPAWNDPLRESKFFAEMLFLVLLGWAAVDQPGSARPK